MPRERIYTQHSNPQHSEPPPFATEVVWHRDHGYIQLATTCRDGADRIVSILNEWLTEAGQPTIDAGTVREKLAAGEHPDPDFDGWYATLERREDVNRLIRVLRRARDQAFGRDE